MCVCECVCCVCVCMCVYMCVWLCVSTVRRVRRVRSGRELVRRGLHTVTECALPFSASRLLWLSDANAFSFYLFRFIYFYNLFLFLLLFLLFSCNSTLPCFILHFQCKFCAILLFRTMTDWWCCSVLFSIPLLSFLSLSFFCHLSILCCCCTPPSL